MTTTTERTGIDRRGLMAIARSMRSLLIIPIALGVATFVWINGAVEPARVSVAEQTMVVSGLDYSEIPAAHGHHRELLTSPVGNDTATPRVDLGTPFGEHATVFMLRAERPIGSGSDADAVDLPGHVNAAAERLLDPATARDAADLFRSPSEVTAELEQARRGLDAATELLDAAREQRTRLLTIGADPGLSEAASQDSWSAAAERDVMVRRVAELELRAEAELLMTPYQVSRIGSPETRVESGANLGLLAGLAAAIAAAVAATAALFALAMTRRTLTSIEQVRAVCARTPIVDLTTDNPSDGIAHLERLVDGDGAEIVEIDMDLDGSEQTMIRQAIRTTEHSARPTRVVACCRLGSTNGSALRRELARLDDESLHPAALVCLPKTPNPSRFDDTPEAADRPTAPATIGARTVEPDAARRSPVLTLHSAASIADDS